MTASTPTGQSDGEGEPGHDEVPLADPGGPAEVPPEKRYLTVHQAAFIDLGAMVGAGIFALLGAAGEVAGAAVWLSFLIADRRGLQGYSFAKLGTRTPAGAAGVRGKSSGNGRFTGSPRG